MSVHSSSPQNTVTMATAETRLVVDSLVSDDLFHLIHSFPALNTDVLHHRSGSNLHANRRTHCSINGQEPTGLFCFSDTCRRSSIKMIICIYS